MTPKKKAAEEGPDGGSDGTDNLPSPLMDFNVAPLSPGECARIELLEDFATQAADLGLSKRELMQEISLSPLIDDRGTDGEDAGRGFPEIIQPKKPSELAAAVPTDWLVYQRLPESSLVLLYGASGSGKSFIALDMACAVALGRTWHGLRVQAGPVVLISAEGGQGGFGLRIRALAQSIGIPVSELDGQLHVIPAPVPIVDQIQNLMVLCHTLSPKLLVVDTLSRCSSGDEDAAGFTSVLDAAALVRDETGATVLIIHHTGKDESRGARGHSKLTADMDAVLRLESKENGKSAVLVVEKFKDARAGGKDVIQFEEIKLWSMDEKMDVDSTGKQRTSLVVTAVTPWKTVESGPLGCLRIVHTLSTHATDTGLTTTTWRDLCTDTLRISKSVFYKYRTQAIQENNYVEENQSRNTLTAKGKQALKE